MNEQEYIELFSQVRINSYTSIDEHEKNFEMLGNIAPKLARIEIIIRNRIDRKMSKSDENWLWHLPDTIKLDDDNGSIKDHNTLISRQTFGFWIKVVEHYKIHSCAFNKEFLDDFYFKEYCEYNKDKIKKSPLNNYQKASALLLLIRAIRNRAFHFENLLKINSDGKPRLSTLVSFNASKLLATVEPQKIIKLLNNVLVSFNKDLIK